MLLCLNVYNLLLYLNFLNILLSLPLTFNEFEERINQVVFVSATPADYENEHSGNNVVEQIIRPTVIY